MDATLVDGPADGPDRLVRAGTAAREQCYDARGYGRPAEGGDLLLAPVEAAHLLWRGDLTGVDGMDFAAFLSSSAVSAVDYAVYADLRDRGFYLSPATHVDDAAGSRGAAGTDDPATPGDDVDFAVYPRGKGPWDDAVAHRVRAISERTTVPASTLGDVVLAVVDEESAVTYLETSRPAMAGASEHDVGSVEGDLLDERVVCWDPPAALYGQAFYGQPLAEADGAVQLSLVEAAYLAERGVLTVENPGEGEDGGAERTCGGAEQAVDGSGSDDGAVSADGAETLRERGRAVEGADFDRRLRVYAVLRDDGVVPKTGFKFGADFRTYDEVESVEDLGHSERLVRVLPADHDFRPRELALDVRLAHGVRKQMTFALVGDDGVDWLAVERLTP